METHARRAKILASSLRKKAFCVARAVTLLKQTFSYFSFGVRFLATNWQMTCCIKHLNALF